MPPASLTAVVLAGGRATRMGGADKGLREFRGRPLAAQICEAIAPQVAEVLISANRNHAEYRAFGCAVIEDELSGSLGPLAGMHAALRAAAYPWLLTLPCDSPFVRPDYAARMLEAARAQNAQLAVAHDGMRAQPVHMLLHRELTADLENFLREGGRKIDQWHARHNCATADFSGETRMFLNANTPEEWAEMEKME
ncbi:MAG: molybdenum cofactor guanylyltransferase [Gammaproteobacteria bacterium]|nr:molybdenum cofactor guanylyltransferase [Gammaproteobacteria bacterium]